MDRGLRVQEQEQDHVRIAEHLWCDRRAAHLLADERVLDGRELFAAVRAARVDRPSQEEVPKAVRLRLLLQQEYHTHSIS